MDISEQLAKERRARMAAERLLELKQVELREANRKLSRHALSLSDNLVEQRVETEQVKEELESANSQIEVVERRLWDSIESIHDGFAVFDQKGVLLVANSAYLLPFEDLEEAKPGVTYRRLLLLAAEEGIVDIGDMTRRDWLDQMDWRWQQSGIDPTVVKLWNGMSIKLVDQRSRDGDLVSLALNITDTIRKEAKLRDARHRAEAANRAKSAFLANMSHEIRTPMNGVVAMADLLAESELDEEQQIYVDTIKSSGEALLVLINDVLDYSKIEADKLTIRPIEFDFEQTLHDVARMLQTTARRKDLDILIDYDMFLPREFVGDGGRIRQVLTNLVGNAIKFTNEGHVLIRAIGLPCAAEPGHQKLHITVEDTGIGIPQDKLDHIFGDFNQVEDERNRRYDGTGLGLSISKRIITLMGGDIWVDSELGEGSSFGFSVTMPIVEGQESPEDVVPKWLERVIVADAQGQQREILAKQLAARGLRVVNAGSLDEILGIGLQPSDVLLLSSNLIEKNGIEDLRTLEGQGAVILLSGAPVSKEEGSDFFAAHLHRPVRRADLFAALRNIDRAPAASASVKQEVQQAESASSVYEDQGYIGSTDVAPADVAHAPGDNLPHDDMEASLPRKMRILAADDNKTNRFVFSKLVKALDIDLTFATNGREAVEAFLEIDPDIIFMDISMPEMDGKEATRQIRSIETKESLPPTTIVALTAHAMDGDDKGILAAGLDYYLTKPFKKDAIIARIESERPAECLPLFAEEKMAS